LALTRPSAGHDVWKGLPNLLPSDRTWMLAASVDLIQGKTLRQTSRQV
jgi:hypothetical protein